MAFCRIKKLQSELFYELSARIMLCYITVSHTISDLLILGKHVGFVEVSLFHCTVCMSP